MGIFDGFMDMFHLDTTACGDQPAINPASGLPMVGCLDIHGNPYGVADPVHSDPFEHCSTSLFSDPLHCSIADPIAGCDPFQNNEW